MAPSVLIGGRLLGNPLLDFASVIGGLQAEIYVDYQSTAVVETNLTTYTYSGQTVGPGGIAKSKDRLIVIIDLSADGSATEGDRAKQVTVGGVNATCWSQAAGQASVNEGGIGIWTFADTGLVTADIACVYEDNRARAGIAVYNVGNVEHEAPHFINSHREDANGTSIAMELQATVGELGIAAVISQSSASQSVSWDTGFEEVDAVLGTSGTWYGINSLKPISGDTGTLTATLAASEKLVMACAVWRQVNASPSWEDLAAGGIHEILWVGAAADGSNAVTYTFSNAAVGRIAGANEQKTLMLIVHGGDSANSSTLYEVQDARILGTDTGTGTMDRLLIANNAIDTDPSNKTVAGGIFLKHYSDTGTTSDIVIDIWNGTTGTRMAYSLYAIYHDSGYAITLTDSGTHDSGDGRLYIKQPIGSYTFVTYGGYDASPVTWHGDILNRHYTDAEGGDDFATWDDGDDTGGNVRFHSGDTGHRKDNVGSPGGYREMIFEGGTGNENTWIWFNIK